MSRTLLNRMTKLGCCAVAALFVVGFAGPALAKTAAKKIGKAVTVTGVVTVIRGKDKTAMKSGDPVFEHDVFETAAKAKLAITFTDRTAFAIGPKSRIAIDTYFFDPKKLKGSMLARIKRGTMMVRTGRLTKQNPGSIRIKTPRTVLGVRGTTFIVSVTP
jgi:hypothetical protein